MSKQKQWIVVGILFIGALTWILVDYNKDMDSLDNIKDAISNGTHSLSAEETVQSFIKAMQNSDEISALEFCASSIKAVDLIGITIPDEYKLDKRTFELDRGAIWVRDQSGSVALNLDLVWKDTGWLIDGVRQ